MYSGPLFLPTTDMVFELIAPLPYSCKESSINIHEGQRLGMKFISTQNGVNLFHIPVGAKFKIKISKDYDSKTNRYNREPCLYFTTTLNRGGPFKGGLLISLQGTLAEVKQLS